MTTATSGTAYIVLLLVYVCILQMASGRIANSASDGCASMINSQVYSKDCNESVGCPKYYEPVCGSDGQTYDNKCFLLFSKRCIDKTITCIHQGTCEGDEFLQRKNLILISNTITVASRCTLPLRRGLCRAYLRNYYFDVTTSTCKLFVYGGCRGNTNRFLTKDECIRVCGAS